MTSFRKDNENYAKKFPEMRKWLNECVICQTIGYKPNLPENIYPRVLAQNIRKIYNVLEVNEINICSDCEKHWNKKQNEK